MQLHPRSCSRSDLLAPWHMPSARPSANSFNKFRNRDASGMTSRLAAVGVACAALLAGGLAPAAPPALLKDINALADATGSTPSALCVAGSTVFFIGSDPLHG